MRADDSAFSRLPHYMYFIRSRTQKKTWTCFQHDQLLWIQYSVVGLLIAHQSSSYQKQ